MITCLNREQHVITRFSMGFGHAHTLEPICVLVPRGCELLVLGHGYSDSLLYYHRYGDRECEHALDCVGYCDSTGYRNRSESWWSVGSTERQCSKSKLHVVIVVSFPAPQSGLLTDDRLQYFTRSLALIVGLGTRLKSKRVLVSINSVLYSAY